MTSENQNATEPAAARESIWSVPPGYRAFYFALFIIQSVIGIAYIVWREIWVNATDSFHETVSSIILMDVAIIAHSAGTGVIITESKMVLAQYLENHYYGPKRKKALAEAKAEGRKELAAEMRAWNERRLEAIDKGEPFDEPFPMDDEPDE